MIDFCANEDMYANEDADEDPDDGINYDEIIALTQADVEADRYHTLEETIEFFSAVVAQLERERAGHATYDSR